MVERYRVFHSYRKWEYVVPYIKKACDLKERTQALVGTIKLYTVCDQKEYVKPLSEMDTETSVIPSVISKKPSEPGMISSEGLAMMSLLF